MLAQKFIIKVFASILSSVFMFVSLLIMTRYVGSEYGVMMWGWAMVGLISTISDLGFDAASVKFISEGRDLNACISTHLFLKSALIGTFFLITMAYLAFSIFTESISQEKTTLVVIFVAYYVIANFTWVIIRVFDGRLEATKSSVIQASEAIARSSILIMLALLGSSAVILSMGYVCGAVFSAVIALYLFRKVGYKPVRPAYLRDYIVFARPIAVGLFLVMAISFFDRVIVEFFWNTAELGYYSVTMGLVYAATAIGVALNYVLLPKFSELFSAGDRGMAESVLWKSEKFISILFIPVIIFMLVFGDSIATVLFGADFAPAGRVVSILSLYIYLNIMLGILTQVLYSTNNSRLYRNSTIAYAASAFILLIILVPENIGGVALAGLGASGAAVAITIGNLVFITLINHYVRAKTGLSLHRGLIRQLIAAAAVFAVVFLVWGGGMFGLLPLLLLLLLCFALFGALLFLLKEMNMDDIRFILSALNLRKMNEN